ncbi:MAG: hypothetical protein EOP06_13800 [Proteobacteria bacterium]|nr:MAG: hypothetical protein EOP06_13800 [Pseudomonadota bacterium]
MGDSEFGRGGFLGLLLGAPLGVVTAFSARAWRNKNFHLARSMAFIGAALYGGFWFSIVWSLSAASWIFEFGFIVPPIFWSFGLLIFAIFGRSHEPSANRKRRLDADHLLLVLILVAMLLGVDWAVGLPWWAVPWR